MSARNTAGFFSVERGTSRTGRAVCTPMLSRTSGAACVRGDDGRRIGNPHSDLARQARNRTAGAAAPGGRLGGLPQWGTRARDVMTSVTVRRSRHGMQKPTTPHSRPIPPPLAASASHAALTLADLYGRTGRCPISVGLTALRHHRQRRRCGQRRSRDGKHSGPLAGGQGTVAHTSQPVPLPAWPRATSGPRPRPST